MDDLKYFFKENYLLYASYVILDRAIPDVADGLKPVQRRILSTLFEMDDGKLHKVANVSGQTMALHPHGDAPINDALINLANKGYLLDRQGNFGSPQTGDPAAAPRYIETRLSKMAKETLFNPRLTQYLPSYDGRKLEPKTLPAKIPLLLMQGAEGIAVGMSTRILPHNFSELIEAMIGYLRKKSFTLVPDFPSGGVMDATHYDDGRGKVRLRAKIDTPDEKTLIIREICYGTTTDSLIRSIDEAAKKGKLKIDSINDYTAEKIEIEIKLPRGQYASEVIDALYAFTQCQVTIHAIPLVIRDQKPWETTVSDILRHNTDLLQGYLKKELELERDDLLQKIFDRTLERIFIENRLYKNLEKVSSADKLLSTVDKSLTPFHLELSRLPKKEDLERLLSIPIRRISRFDSDKNEEQIRAFSKRLEEVEKHLKKTRAFTISYLESLKKSYAKEFPRRTEIQELEQLDRKAIATKNILIGYDPETGYLGTKVSTGESALECTNFDKIVILYQNGAYTVIPAPEKRYVHTQDSPIVWVGIADKRTVLSVVYREKKTGFCYAKRFIVKQFILEKWYQFLREDDHLMLLSHYQHVDIELRFKKQKRQKVKKITWKMEEVPVKGVKIRGVRIANKEVDKIDVLREEGEHGG